MPFGPPFSSLPVTGTPPKRVFDEDSYTELLGNFSNWPDNVNAGGHNLSNVGAVSMANLTTQVETITGANPFLTFHNTTGAADAKRWIFQVSANAITGYITNDAETVSGGEWLYVKRIGNALDHVRLAPKVGIGVEPVGLLHIFGVNQAGADSITGLLLDRVYSSVGDSMDIVWGSGAPNRAGRISCAAVAGGEAGLIFYAQTASGDGYSNEVMRMEGNGRVRIVTTTTHADNAAAIAAGLTSGQIYRKSDGTLMIVF